MRFPTRYPLIHLTPYSINHMHIRKPWMMVWMSASFPGYGHILLCKYLEGYIFIVWEFFINYKIHLNHAIYLSMVGQFEQAAKLVNTRWFLLYVTVYVFQMWHCYRLTLQLNQFAVLARRENAPNDNFQMNSLEINYLYRRNPKLAMVWSAFTPGLGHIYLNELPTGFFEFLWFAVTSYQSNLLHAVFLTLRGDFAQATSVLDPQWLLFVPSVYLFNIYTTYMNGKEFNKYYDIELARYVTSNYQKHRFLMANTGKPKGGV